MRKNSTKNLRVNGEVLRELSAIIRDLKDPRIGVMTTLTEVQVAPDLKTCKVYVSVLGGDGELADTMKGLRSAEGYIRRELAHRLNLRNTPELTFLEDRSIARGVEMSKLIDEVNHAEPES